MNTISINYALKWQYKLNNKYQWSECGKLFNTHTGKQIKKVVNGGSIGYWIGKKFITLTHFGQTIEMVKKVKCPF